MKVGAFRIAVAGVAGALLVLTGCADREDIGYRSGNQAADRSGGNAELATPGTFIDIDAGRSARAVTTGSGSQQGVQAGSSGSGLSAEELAIEPDVGTPVESMTPPVTERSALPDAEGYTELDWDELLPVGFSFDPWLDQVDIQSFELDTMDDTDPEAQRLYDELKDVLSDVPVNDALSGVAARLPGFVVPLDFDGTHVYRFLLVPYFGACIHTPPPPANQMVYVEYPEGYALSHLYDPVMISGTFELDPEQTAEFGTAGYSMVADTVRVY